MTRKEQENSMQSVCTLIKITLQKLIISSFMFTVIIPGVALANDQNTLAHWLTAPHRTQANVVRDAYRHPIETLTFFGVNDNSTVVEILPGSRGYYLEILAPYLKPRGHYIAANRDESAAPQ